MKRERHTSEQIVRNLRDAERLTGEGLSLGPACQRLEVSDQTYHRRKAEYGSGSPLPSLTMHSRPRILPGLLKISRSADDGSGGGPPAEESILF